MPAAGAQGGTELISIVLVEADAGERNALHRGLARGGFTTQAFADPEQALAEITRNPSRLLIADADLPGMTGSELAERVRAARPEVRILLLTESPDERFSYQIKPVPVSELVERVGTMFM
jgi:DNA-binding response OmpR family regulator